MTKLLARPVVRDGDTVRIAVDDDTDVELRAPGGTVTDADAIHCGCLLAPGCLHRAAAASAAPVAEDTPAPAEATETEKDAETAPAEPDAVTPEQRAAARAVFDAAAAVLEAGTDGAGAVLQAELLQAAHAARLAGLPRASAAAVSVVTGVRAARSADPAHRLTDLAGALSGVLGVAHRIPHTTGPGLTGLRGTVRQPYRTDGSLRLYGLFSEPVLTATGYAGAVTWTADADGRLYTVSDVAPGGPARATGAADRAVRIGDTALTHRELSRAGLAVSGATVSPTGRLGAGAGVRAVRASGAAWRAEPLDRLWTVSAAEQVARALGGGQDLLFLEVTLAGPVREATGDGVLADCAGLPLRLVTAHDDPALPYRDNLRLLAAAGGRRLRIVARLAPGPAPRALLLAAEHPTDPDARVDLGLDRLQHADLPKGAVTPRSRPARPSTRPRCTCCDAASTRRCREAAGSSPSPGAGRVTPPGCAAWAWPRRGTSSTTSTRLPRTAPVTPSAGSSRPTRTASPEPGSPPPSTPTPSNGPCARPPGEPPRRRSRSRERRYAAQRTVPAAYSQRRSAASRSRAWAATPPACSSSAATRGASWLSSK